MYRFVDEMNQLLTLLYNLKVSLLLSQPPGVEKEVSQRVLIDKRNLHALNPLKVDLSLLMQKMTM